MNDRGAATRLFFPAYDVGSETLTLDFRPSSHFSLRLKGRNDHAHVPIYFRGTVSSVGGVDRPNARTQATVTLGAGAWF